MAPSHEACYAACGPTANTDHHATFYNQVYPSRHRLNRSQQHTTSSTSSKHFPPRTISHQSSRYSLSLSSKAVSQRDFESDDNGSRLFGPSPRALVNNVRWPKFTRLSHKLERMNFGPFPPVTRMPRLTPSNEDISLQLFKDRSITKRPNIERTASAHNGSEPPNSSSAPPILPRSRDKRPSECQASFRATSSRPKVPHKLHGAEILPLRPKPLCHSQLTTCDTSGPISLQPSFQVAHNTYVPPQVNHGYKGDEGWPKFQTCANGESSSSQNHGQRSSGGKRGRQSGGSPSHRKRPTKSGRGNHSSGMGHTNGVEGEDGEESETDHDNNSKGKEKETKQPRSRKGGIYACPFCKHDSNLYEECSKHKLSAYPQVLSHIKKKHGDEVPTDVLQCDQCKVVFNDNDQWSAHQDGPPCEFVDGALRPSIQLLHKKIRRGSKYRDLTVDQENYEKWIDMYQILFPHDIIIPTPYTLAHDNVSLLRDRQAAVETLVQTIPSAMINDFTAVLDYALTPQQYASLLSQLQNTLVCQFTQAGLVGEFPAPIPPVSNNNNNHTAGPSMGARAQIGAQFDTPPVFLGDCLEPWTTPNSSDLPFDLSLQQDELSHSQVTLQPPIEYTRMLDHNAGYDGTMFTSQFHGSDSIDPSCLDMSDQAYSHLKPTDDSGYHTGSHTTEDQIGGRGCWMGQ